MAASAAPAGNADEGMHGVPHRIEQWNLVGEKFDRQHQARRAQHPGMFEHLQARRQHDPAQAAGHADDEERGVQAQAGCPAQPRGKSQQPCKVQRQMSQIDDRSSAGEDCLRAATIAPGRELARSDRYEPCSGFAKIVHSGAHLGKRTRPQRRETSAILGHTVRIVRLSRPSMKATGETPCMPRFIC
jgi:hypothetical protein